MKPKQRMDKSHDEACTHVFLVATQCCREFEIGSHGGCGMQGRLKGRVVRFSGKANANANADGERVDVVILQAKRRVSSSCFDLVGWTDEAQTVTSRCLFPHQRLTA